MGSSTGTARKLPWFSVVRINIIKGEVFFTTQPRWLHNTAHYLKTLIGFMLNSPFWSENNVMRRITLLKKTFFEVPHFRPHFIRESHSEELNDSLISAICLKAGSITQACRTADKQHFTLATTVLCWFYHTSFPWAATDPPSEGLIAWKMIICAGKSKAQSLSEFSPTPTL